MGEKWEKGVIKGLTENCHGALTTEKQEEEATRIYDNIKDFDTDHRSYFTAFVLSEIVKSLLCLGTFIYYFYMLNLREMDILTVYSANREDHLERTDALIELFPREIGCIWEYVGPSGTMVTTDMRCKCTSNGYNEAFHLITLTVSIAVLCLYVLNIVYIITQMFIVHAGNPTAKRTHVWHRLTFSKRLILILLRNNLASTTYNKVLDKVCDAKVLRKNENFSMQPVPVARKPFIESMV